MNNTKLAISNFKNEKDLSNRLLDFAVSVIKIADILPDTFAGRHVGGQLIRSQDFKWIELRRSLWG